MEKQMIVRFVDGYEGRQDLIFEVNDEESMRALRETLLAHSEFPEDDMPKLKVEMFTPEQVEEANRIGEAMA